MDSRVLVPRPETELIVETILHSVQDRSGSYQILDMGTGSGCIGLSLLKELKNAQLTALDISSNALEVFKENAESLQLSDRVRAINESCESASRLAPSLKGAFDSYDIIVANPPYIDPKDKDVCPNVVKHEPHVALFTEGGIQSPLRWMKEASRLLRNQESVFMMEFGVGQGDTLKQESSVEGVLNKVQLIQDYTHRDRFLIGWGCNHVDKMDLKRACK